MTSLRRSFPALVLLVLTLAVACAPAGATIRVGIGDQSAALFSDPRFEELDLRQARYFVRWDAIRHRDQRLGLRAWVKQARAAGARPLIHLSTSTFDPKKAPRPSVARYRSDATRLVDYLRRLGVRDFGTFNEANHKTQPTWDSPSHAALYFKAMYRAVHRRCSTRHCRVVALDVLDQPGVERYIERFYDRLSTRTWRNRAKIIGVHNYSDVNRGSTTRTRGIIKEVRSHQRGAKFWFTETGGLVGFGAGFPCDPASSTSVSRAEGRAKTAVRRVFSLARTYESVGVQRVYLYNWFGTDCAPNSRADTAGRDADEFSAFDAGLVRTDGTARPALGELSRQLRGRTFAP